MKKIKILLIILSIIIITGCKKEIPFGDNYDIKYSKITDTFEVPLYFSTEDMDGNPKQVDGIEFQPAKMTYKFRDYKISKPDKFNNVEMSITLDLTSMVEFKYNHKDKDFKYKYIYKRLGFFDYNTGYYYREKAVTTVDNQTLIDNGIDNEEKMKYTTIKWKDKKYKIGIIQKIIDSPTAKPENLGREGEYSKYKTPVSLTYEIKIKAPKDYDGIMIAINKKGYTKETYEKSITKSQKLVALQKKAKEEGKKSKELIKLEKENDRINKVDKSKKKSAISDNYYIIKTADVFNIKPKKEFDYTPIIIGASIILSIIILGTVIFIIIRKNRKKVQ